LKENYTMPEIIMDKVCGIKRQDYN
jgi:hypothetical protein